MPEPLRVYISSTIGDLTPYRAAVVDVLRRLGLHAVLLEDLPASEHPPLDVIFRAVAESDIVILLLAYRLGYVSSERAKSIVELEYDFANANGKPVLAFVIDEDQPWPPMHVDQDQKRVARFRERLLRDRPVTFFTTPEDLAAKVAAETSRFSSRAEAISAPPSTTTISSEISLADVISELKFMRAEINILQQTVGESLRGYLREASNERSRYPTAEFLGSSASSVNVGACFVIMPYSQKWSGAVERIILEICSHVGLEFHIAKNMEGRFIPHDIWRGITSAGVIIADLSGANPNVTYEIGLADVLGKEIIMISQHDKVPFDFLAQRLVVYEDSLSGTLRLREELTSRLQKYKARVDLQQEISMPDRAG